MRRRNRNCLLQPTSPTQPPKHTHQQNGDNLDQGSQLQLGQLLRVWNFEYECPRRERRIGQKSVRTEDQAQQVRQHVDQYQCESKKSFGSPPKVQATQLDEETEAKEDDEVVYNRDDAHPGMIGKADSALCEKGCAGDRR